jgi:hypothetical protein
MSLRASILGFALCAAQAASAAQIWQIPAASIDVGAWRRAEFRVELLGDMAFAIGGDAATAPQAATRIALPDGLAPFVLGLHDEFLALPPGVLLLARGDRLALVALDPQRLPEVAALEHLIPITPPPPGARTDRPLRRPAGKAIDPAIKTEIVDAVDGAAIEAHVQTLIDEVGDRYTYREGDEEAADHLEAVLVGLGYAVQRQTWVQASPHVVHNLVAVKPGTLAPQEIVVVGAHYDATSSRDSNDGPALGAEDNGSGTGAVLHLAEILRDYASERTIHFVLFAMEEQGLYGSEHYVDLALANGDNIVGALTMDMIAAWTNNYRMTIEGWSAAQGDPGSFELMQLVDANVAQYSPSLQRQFYTPGFGSDHVPFHVAGIPAMLAIETDYSIYSGYHRLSDTMENASLHFDTIGRDIVRGMAGALVDLAGVHESQTAVALSGFVAERLGFAVRLRWDVAGASQQLSLWREAGGASRLLAQLDASEGRMEFVDELLDVEPGSLRYRLVAAAGAVATTSIELPADFALQILANSPNPFRAEDGTLLRFVMPQRGRVTVRLYDVAGRLVRELVHGESAAGLRTQRWDGRDARGRRVAAGVYFVQLAAFERERTRRISVAP